MDSHDTSQRSGHIINMDNQFTSQSSGQATDMKKTGYKPEVRADNGHGYPG